MVHPLHFAGFDVDGGQPRGGLGVADIRPPGDIFGVPGVGDIVRHHRVPGVAGLCDGSHVLDFAQGGAPADRLQQLLLLFLEVLLAVGAALLAGGCRCRRFATSATPAAGPRSWRLGADVGHLDQQARIQRHHVQIIGSREVDPLAVRQKTRIRFHVGGLRDLPALSGGVIGNKDVAVAREDREPFVFAGVGFRAPAPAAATRGCDPAARRRQPGFLVGELAQPGAVAVDHIGVERRVFLIDGLLPLEVDALAIGGPAHLRRLKPHQCRTAHDVVDGQRKVVGWPGLED